MADKVNLYTFSKEVKSGKIERQYENYLKDVFSVAELATIFKKMLDQVMDLKSDQIDYEHMIESVSKLNPRIELLMTVQKYASVLNKGIAKYADTTSNLHLTHEERTKMNYEQLMEANMDDKWRQNNDINLYTTKHFLSGKLILEQLRVK